MAVRRKPAAQAAEEIKVEQAAEEIKVEQAADLQSGDVVGADDELLEEKSDTVCVCANVPHDIKFSVPDNSGRMQTITIKGNGNHLKGLDRGILPIGAYGITTNVPAEAWDYIKTAYCDNRAIRNGLIFAVEASKARAAAKERKDLRNGLEPIEPKKARNSEPFSG